MVGSDQGEVISETHLCMVKAQGQSMEFPDQELGPCEGILMSGSKED
jgi:hypothetical protein